jgi:hypothetical protein
LTTWYSGWATHLLQGLVHHVQLLLSLQQVLQELLCWRGWRSRCCCWGLSWHVLGRAAHAVLLRMLWLWW